jgi:hypothetical protein
MKLALHIPSRAFLLGAIALMLASSAFAEALSPTLKFSLDSVELGVGRQRVAFSRKGPEAPFAITTSIRKDDQWETMFDAGRPLLRGASFDLAPTEYEVLADTRARKEVLLRGRQTTHSYDYEIRVEASAGNPLIKLEIICRLPNGLKLSGLEPVAALWMSKPEVEMAVDQGPDSIYGSLGIPHGFGFPAAYVWDEGKESAVFFEMSPMTWFSPGGVHRFHDIRIMTQPADGNTGLGMHLKKVSGSRIPAGEMVTVFHLHGAPRAAKPARLEAVGRMIEIFAPLHPGTSKFPKNYLHNREVSWEDFTRRAIEDLMRTNVTYREIEALWNDAPLGLVGPHNKLLVHSGSSRDEGSSFGWDFSTVNNHLSPWILYTRLNPDDRMRAFALNKRDGLPRFYDPNAGIIRHGTREPAHVGDMEMSWQNFFFHFEMLRVYDALAPEDFNPAVAGRLLMSADGLIELARNVDYVFPQWWNPYLKEPADQKDVPQLGKVREPWQVGAYAYIMMRAFEITGDGKYLEEARHSIRTLLTDMEYTVSNEVYTRTYTDPADFPVTELFGNSYGVAAARKVAEATGEKVFLGYSRDFLHTLLRLTFWYEDATDVVSQDLRSAGLFYPHGGAHVATSWETFEAYVGIVDALGRDLDNPLCELLLKLCNLNRMNSFYFYPAVYTPAVQALDANRRKDIGQYFPIEPFYSLEGMGGHIGPTAAYMAGLGMWNYWLYEALADADDREVMVLNTAVLENFEEALSAERSFIVFNPTDTAREIRLRVKHLSFLSGSRYELSIRDRSGRETKDVVEKPQLEEGYSLALAPQEHRRMIIRSPDAASKKKGLRAARLARDKLSYAYARLHRAGKGGEARDLDALTALFHTAMQDYREKDYEAAARLAADIVGDLE